MIEVRPTELEEYRHLAGAQKTIYWRKNKKAIIWQGRREDELKCKDKKRRK